MNVAIIGVGLIGGSVGKGLISSGFAENVYGLDTCPQTLGEAIEREAIHDVLDVAGQSKTIDMWVLAAPPEGIRAWLDRLVNLVHPETIITDVASVKGSICDAVPAPLRKSFLGGHPMAGKERGGIENSVDNLFQGKHWILTPIGAPAVLERRAEQMVYALDAIPVYMSAEDHDAHVALLSHVPNILANVLQVFSRDLKSPEIGGGSWNDLTRVAGGDPRLWEQILLHNGPKVSEVLGALKLEIERLETAVREGDAAKVQELFHRAQKGSKA